MGGGRIDSLVTFDLSSILADQRAYYAHYDNALIPHLQFSSATLTFCKPHISHDGGTPQFAPDGLSLRSTHRMRSEWMTWKERDASWNGAPEPSWR